MASKKLPTLHRAVKYACKMHRGMDRDGGFPLPYVTHPLDVATKLRYIALETDENVLTAAILHDVIEESEAAFEDIEARFGATVKDLVKELTRREPPPGSTKGMSDEEIWQMRSDLLLEDIRNMSLNAKRIKLADRLSNLENALATRPPDRLARYVQQTYLILEAIPREASPELWDAIRKLIES